jgi:hypothetical protein
MTIAPLFLRDATRRGRSGSTACFALVRRVSVPLHEPDRRQHPAGNKAITDAQVRRAAEQARAASFISAFRRVRHRAAGARWRVSLGQKQLISIARAFAFDPSS